MQLRVPGSYVLRVPGRLGLIKAAFTVINTINSAGVWQDTAARQLLHMRRVLHRAVVHIAAGTLYVHVGPLKLSERLRL